MTGAREIEPVACGQLLTGIKARIHGARVRAALAGNRELIRLYWEIRTEIVDREDREGWGAKVIDRLAADLRREFPDMTGLGRANLFYMRAFAHAWPAAGGPIVQQPVGQLPWGHNVALLTGLKERDARLWYAQKSIEHGWSRAVLEAQISTDLRGREGEALTSFSHTLPPACWWAGASDGDEQYFGISISLDPREG